ncbi:MAG: DDE-type integrase/transposase/recombinase [Verrucomicrobiae bacterium]|nr:DDE-type integrase/transposase/recombinase [Verrucomicrobiae bacterium]
MNRIANHANELLMKPSQIQRVVEKRSLIEEFKRSGLSINRFARQRSVGVVSLWRDLKRAQMGIDGLIDRRTRRQSTGVHIEDAVLSWTLAYLATYPKTTIQSAWRKLASIAHERGWQYPSYDQLCRAIRHMPQDMRTLLTAGARAHFEEWGIVKRKENTAPNELWQIDATELDLWVLDTATGELFRPWMTSLIDGHSRVILTAWLHRNVPDTAETLQALRRAILPKDSESYPFYGIPQKIQSDNGQVYEATDFLEALLRLNIEKVSIPNQCPSANGKIERWFETCKVQLLQSLAGFTGQHAALAKAKKCAIPWPLLPKLVEKYLLQYHLATHSSLGMSPWEAWHNKLADAKGLNFVSQDVVDAIKIRREMTVERDGVELSPGRHYHSAKLAGLVGETVTLRIPPEGPLNGDPVEAYHKGDFIDHLRCVEANPSLARQIGEARLERVIELQRLRKTLRETADGLIPKAASEVGGGPSMPVIPETPPVSEANPGESALNIPKLPTEDKP